MESLAVKSVYPPDLHANKLWAKNRFRQFSNPLVDLLYQSGRSVKSFKRMLYRTFAPRELIENEFPVSELVFPQNFYLYMDHLHSLNLAGLWQDGNQEPIEEGEPPKQTGVNIKSIAQLTPFGRLFAKACVPQSLDVANV